MTVSLKENRGKSEEKLNSSQVALAAILLELIITGQEMLPSKWPIQIDSEKEITDEVNILNFAALSKTSELLLQYTQGYWPYQVFVLDKPCIC